MWDEAERSIYNSRLSPGGEFAAVSQFGALRYAEVPFASASGRSAVWVMSEGGRLLPFGRGAAAWTVGFSGLHRGFDA